MLKWPRRRSRRVTVSPHLIAWLLKGGEPSVRRRVYRELLGRKETDPRVLGATRRIGRVGWAARILDEQLDEGQWVTPRTDPESLYRPKYIATNWRLIVLAELGVSGELAKVRKAVDLYLRVYGRGPRPDLGGRRGEACFTGNAVRLLVSLGRGDDPRVRRAIQWLLDHQKADGGWHCFRSRTGTLDAWEPLAAFAVLPPSRRSPEVERAIERGAEFYLARGLTKEGRGTYAPWFRLHYPTHYYYDLLVGLGLLVHLGYQDDRRLRPALDRLEAKRNADGTWNLDALHPDSEDPNYPIRRAPFYPFALEVPGQPSRWITLNALEVLRACGRV